MNRVQPPFEAVAPAAFTQALNEASVGDELRLVVSGPDYDTGEPKETTLVMPISSEASGEDRLNAFGLLLMADGDAVNMDEPSFGSPFSNSLSSFDFYGDDPVTIASVQAPAGQMPKEIIFLPALLFLALIAFLQNARISKNGVPS